MRQPVTERILMLSRVNGTSIGLSAPSRLIESVTTSPAGPVIRSTARLSDQPVVLWPFTATIRSCGLMPARIAGEPSSGLMITMSRFSS